MPQDSQDLPENPSEDRVETPNGSVTLVYLTTGGARVASGRDVGWLRLHGKPLYATAKFEMLDGDWILNVQHSAVASVVDDKAGTPVEPALCDEAWGFLAETFAAWREARPDIAARVALHEHAARERKAEDRIDDLLQGVKSLQETLPLLRQARIEAEAEVERVLSAMPGSPKP